MSEIVSAGTSISKLSGEPERFESNALRDKEECAVGRAWYLDRLRDRHTKGQKDSQNRSWSNEGLWNRRVKPRPNRI